jgi:hypothetical protein
VSWEKRARFGSGSWKGRIACAIYREKDSGLKEMGQRKAGIGVELMGLEREENWGKGKKENCDDLERLGVRLN